MLVRIVIIAALIAVTLGVIQKKDVLQKAGLTGYCTTVATPAGQSGFWHECRPGKMTGTPEDHVGLVQARRHRRRGRALALPDGTRAEHRASVVAGSVDELRRCDLGEGVLRDPGHFVPVHGPVEAKTEPAPMTDVRRPEEPLRIGVDEHFLHPWCGCTPDREAPVAVMVGQDHQKRPLAADEEGRRTVTEALAGLGQPEADLADALESPLALGLVDLQGGADRI